MKRERYDALVRARETSHQHAEDAFFTIRSALGHEMRFAIDDAMGAIPPHEPDSFEAGQRWGLHTALLIHIDLLRALNKSEPLYGDGPLPKGRSV